MQFRFRILTSKRALPVRMPPKKKPAALTAKQEEEELSEMVGSLLFLAIFHIFLNTNFCELLFLETLSPPGDKALLAALLDQGADHDPSHQAGQGRLRWGGVRR